ncbi:lysophospholipase [Pseudomonas sp. NPDC087358]|uniref:alpha/beta hydrolase n=1 Tax=Pseudomonas sp. NPDC087358 TaxID=3364439 RepID=UPI00384B0588
MTHDAYWLDTSDHNRLYVNVWLPLAAPKALVMLAHGMAEHSGRYDRLGAALAEAGFALYAHDQRGHGQTAPEGVLGHYADHDGWNKVVGDLASLQASITQQHPRIPVFVLGHSMGSYVAQAYLLQHSADVQGAILSGSNFQPVSLYRSAAVVARLERWRQGPTGRSALIEFLSFGSFNNRFKPVRTPFDWLSRDRQEVDKYVNDPLCGFRCTNQFWLDMLGGLQHISKTANLAQIDKHLPILIMGGECDPVSQGKRLKDLADALTGTGHARVTLKIYPQARHEILNETNRQEVTHDLLAWLDKALQQPRTPQTA